VQAGKTSYKKENSKLQAVCALSAAGIFEIWAPLWQRLYQLQPAEIAVAQKSRVRT
jgi:hypothetical protein